MVRLQLNIFLLKEQCTLYTVQYKNEGGTVFPPLQLGMAAGEGGDSVSLSA